MLRAVRRLVRDGPGRRRRAVRRRRSVSRILSPRPASGGSSHSSGPPVARGIERPTRGNGRATRARPRRPDLPPTRSCSGWGLPSVRPHERTWRALTSPFHPCSGPRGPGRSPFCGTFPRSLGAAVNGHPALRSPDFPPAARAASDCSTSSGARRAPTLTHSLASLALRPPVQHALAVRAEDHLLVALDLVEELRRNVHAAALAGAVAHLDHRERRRAARRSSRSAGADRRRRSPTSSCAPAALALDLAAEPRRCVSRERRRPRASRAVGERRELGLEAVERLAVAASTCSMHRRPARSRAPPVSSFRSSTSRLASPSSLSLRMRVMRIRRSFILVSAAASRASRSRWRARRARRSSCACGGGGGRLRADGLLERGDPRSLPHPTCLRLRPQALIDHLQCGEQLDLRRQLDLRSFADRRPRRAGWWAQCDSNTRPTGYEPAALTT